MEQKSLRDALLSWQRIANISKRPATVTYHAELVSIFFSRFPDVDTPVASLDASHVATFVEAVAHYSAPRFNALLSLLRIVVPQSPPMRLRAVRPKEVLLPNQQQFSALLVELDNCHRGNSGLVVRFLSLTGLRIKEARLLRWADVRDAAIIVPGSITKNGKPRCVPKLAGVDDVLSRLRAVSPERETVLPHASLKTALRNACDRAGVRRMSHHDMRRLFATRCIESGVDVPTAARWLGHSDGGALLAKTYFHLLDGHSREMAAKVKIAA